MSHTINQEKLATIYWAITVPLLVTGIAYRYVGYLPVILLTVLQLWHFYRLEGSIAAFSVQVRIAYLLILFVTLPPLLHWLAWVLLLGTVIRVLFNYCFLARILSLLPWNRIIPLNWKLLIRTFLTPPTKGSIIQAVSTD